MKTEKYNSMIKAFQSDFTLAKNDEYKLCNLDDLLECQDERLLEDILLLEELEYGLHNGLLEIVEAGENKTQREKIIEKIREVLEVAKIEVANSNDISRLVGVLDGLNWALGGSEICLTN